MNELIYPVYRGDDLGLIKTEEGFQLRIWSPQASAAEVFFYSSGNGDNFLHKSELRKSVDGTWMLSFENNKAGYFYTVRVQIGDRWSDNVADPYAKFIGVNGRRAMVEDIHANKPAGWDADFAPGCFSQQTDRDTKSSSLTHAVIYELHIRDLTGRYR